MVSKIVKSQQHPRASRAVPHPSTDRAFGGLSSEFEWDREFSTEYGRWRYGLFVEWPYGPVVRYQGGSPPDNAIAQPQPAAFEAFLGVLQ